MFQEVRVLVRLLSRRIGPVPVPEHDRDDQKHEREKRDVARGDAENHSDAHCQLPEQNEPDHHSRSRNAEAAEIAGRA